LLLLLTCLRGNIDFYQVEELGARADALAGDDSTLFGSPRAQRRIGASRRPQPLVGQGFDSGLRRCRNRRRLHILLSPICDGDRHV
jgi:hypothetical protein